MELFYLKQWNLCQPVLSNIFWGSNDMESMNPDMSNLNNIKNILFIFT